MDLLQVLHDWGWVGVLVLFAMDKVWPWFTNTVFPAKVKREEEERQFQRKLDERRITAMENVATTVEKALREMSQAMQTGNSNVTMALTVQNERMAQLSGEQRDHDKFTQRALGDVRNSLALMQNDDATRAKKGRQL